MIFNITATQNTLKRCFFFETVCEGRLFAPIIIKSQIGAADTLLNLQHNADYVVVMKTLKDSVRRKMLYMSDEKSVVAINSFVSIAKLKCKGELFRAQIEIFDLCGMHLCQTEADCKISDHTGFMETQFNIMYDFGDDIMKQLDLRGYYGTNWQVFSLDEDKLVITDEIKNREITIKKI